MKTLKWYTSIRLDERRAFFRPDLGLQRNLGIWKERKVLLPAMETWRTVRSRSEALITQLQEPQSGRGVAGRRLLIELGQLTS